MRRLAFVALALCLSATPAPAEPPAATGHQHGYAPPPKGDLGAKLSLRTPSGERFTFDQLRGAPAMVYFGYSRCSSACPSGLAVMAGAVTRLRQAGVAVRAVFVDIEASPVSAPRLLRPVSEAERVAQEQEHGLHHSAEARAMHEASIAALAGTAEQFRDQVTVLTGTRGELNRAVTAFRVRREHVPPRTGEVGHSIDHTTYIYLLDQNGVVVDHRNHEDSLEDLVTALRAIAARPQARR